MKNYNAIERFLAVLLSSAPGLKSKIKYVYQYFNYLVYSGGPKLETNAKIIRLSDEGRDCFFGYYDKSCWSDSGESYCYHRLSLDRSDEMEICCYYKGRFNLIGKSYAWNWQQGSMLTWFNDDTLLFNDVNDGVLGMKIVSADGSESKFYPYPLQALSKDKKWYVSLNYMRLQKLRPDYGYDVEVDNYSPDMNHESDGFSLINTETGDLIKHISLKSIIDFETSDSMMIAEHKVNHFDVSPCSKRVSFMHRWIVNGVKKTRVLVYDLSSSKLFCIFNNDMFSHYDWADSQRIVAWCRGDRGDGYYEIDVDAPLSIPTLLLDCEDLNRNGDGHPSFSPNSRYIVTDTYPARDRKQSLMLFDVKNQRFSMIARLFSPWEYQGIKRCDLHPRWAPDSGRVAFDSTHEGFRGLYCIEISGEA